MDEKILAAHGAGGKLSAQLLTEIILPAFDNEILRELHDGAKIGQIAMTTDSYVVRPIFFNGGDIGKLAVCGTVNNLAVTDAVPKYLSAAVILEEGFDIHALRKISVRTPPYIRYLLLYHTEMRLGEVLGLSWSDIDFAAKRINLHQQLQYLSKRGYFFTTLKTELNNRYIIVDDFLIGELKRWQSQRLNTEAKIKICAEKIFLQQNLSSSNAAGFFLRRLTLI